MPRLSMSVIPIEAHPRNHPADKLIKLWPALEKHMKYKVKPMLVKDMENTTKNWKTKPKMEATISYPYGTRLQLTVEPKGRGSTNWKRISAGTRVRTIRAKTPRGMSFRTGYSPKTTPGGRYGGSGKRYGPWRRKVMTVRRHRIRPRQFSIKILKRREKTIRNGFNDVVRKVKKS